MKPKSNVELIQGFLELQANNRHELNYEDFLHPDVIIHGPATGQKINGVHEAKKIDIGHIPACQKKFEIEEILEVQDRVIVRWICRDGSKCEEPQEYKFAVSGLSIYKVLNGKIAEVWQYWDRLALLGEIGEALLKQDHSKQNSSNDLLYNLGVERYAALAALLTPRERECLKALLAGKTAKETAQMYQLSARTIESYFENIKIKFSCPNKRDLFRIAQVLEKLNLL